ncbi:MAG TPA: hypothetical protein PLF01_03630, partial [Alphaproteobacteria bacterium]|nr:hypothetical protein [Alphaproteobacteria bacterium]
MNVTGAVLADQFDADVTYGAKPTSRKIVHIGATSRFFRAHWADYISDLLEIDPRWGITAIALGHSSDSYEKLQNLSSRGGAYGLMARGAGTPSYKIINAVVDNIHAPGRYDEVLSEMADPEVEIFSMTITDPGYCRNRDSKTPVLDRNDAQIIHDLADLKATNNDPRLIAQPKSAIGL